MAAVGVLFAPHTDTRPGFFLATKGDLVLSRYLPVYQATSHTPSVVCGLLLVSEPSDAQIACGA